MDGEAVETPYGRANAFLHAAEDARAGARARPRRGRRCGVAGSRRGDGRRADARDQRRAGRAALPRRGTTFARACTPARRRVGRGRRAPAGPDARGPPTARRRSLLGCAGRLSYGGCDRRERRALPCVPTAAPATIERAPAPSRLPELDAVDVPTLVVQGARDPFGMPPSGPLREVVEVPGDHSLRSDIQAVAAAAREWLARVV